MPPSVVCAGSFMGALSSAFFTEALAVDVEDVKKWHAAQRACGNARGLSNDELEAKKSQYWRRRCRVSTRPEGEMVAELDRVVEEFSRPDGPGFDRSTSVIIITDGTLKVHDSVKKLVMQGHVCGKCDTWEFVHFICITLLGTVIRTTMYNLGYLKVAWNVLVIASIR